MARKLPDDELQRLHALWSAGQFSNRTLAKDFGISEGMVRKYAKDHDWQKDVQPLIRSEGKSLAARDAAAEFIQKATDTPTAPEKLRPSQVVQAGAQIHAAITKQHRVKLERLTSHASFLLGELEEMATNADKFRNSFEQLMAAAAAADHPGMGKALMAVSEALTAPERIKAFKALTDATDRLLQAERKAYGLDDPGEKGGNLESHLEELADE